MTKDKGIITYKDIVAHVGVGGEFNTVQEACANNYQRIILVSDVTEISNVTYFTDNTRYLDININGYIWNLGDYYLSFSYKANIYNGFITVAKTNTTASFGGSKIIWKNIEFTNNTTYTNTTLASSGTFYNCKLNMPDTTTPRGGWRAFQGNLIDCEIIGRGTISSEGIVATITEPYIENLTISGVGWNGYTTIECSTKGIINGLKIETNNCGTIRAKTIRNLTNPGGSSAYVIPVYGYNLHCFGISGTFLLILDGCITTSTAAINPIANSIFSNSSFEMGNMSVNGIIVSNCKLRDSFSIQGDNNNISNCHVGDTASGIEKITMNGCDKAIITDCVMEDDISITSETNSELRNNRLF